MNPFKTYFSHRGHRGVAVGKKVEAFICKTSSLHTLRLNLPGSSGFTLLELMIVIFLVALLLGLSSFFFANNLSSTRLNAATREMSAVIRYARAQAQMNSSAQTLTIDTDTGEYELEGRGTKKLSPDISIKVLDQTSGEVLQGKQQLIFQAIGGVEARTIVLSGGKKTVNIEMDPVVGSVVIK